MTSSSKVRAIMNFVYISSEYSNNLPSGENLVVDYQISALRSHGHEVEHIRFSTDLLLERSFYRLRSFIRVASGFGSSPVKNMKVLKPDVLVLHNLFPNIGTRWLKKFRKSFPETKIIVFVHNFRFLCASGTLLLKDNHCEKCISKGPKHSLINRCYKDSFFATLPWYFSKKFKVVDRQLIAQVDFLIFLSQKNRSYFQRYNSIAQSFVVQNFVPKLDNPKTIDKMKKNGKWVVVGRLSREKGILKLVQNFPDNQSLDIFGDGEEAQSIKELIKHKPNISLMGKVNPSELAERLPYYYGAIHASIWVEIAPLTILEFHRAGLPIIYTGNNFSPADSEIVVEGVKLEKYTSTNLELAMRKIESQYQDYVLNSFKTYETYYSEEIWLKNFLNCIG
jgi:glycosyltransferase involved in cell wall biosynthesis